jgi:3-oxoacyl-[acyl-carrier protein] reductase
MSNAPTYVEGHGLLKGKNVLVTAAAGTGIGFATALRSVEEGAAALVISDIHERRLGEAAGKIEEATGTRPKTVLCNVTKEDDVQAMFEFAVENMGHVDVLMT